MNAKLAEILEREGASFEVITHPEAYTGRTRAATCQGAGGLAKVVVVRDGGWFAMAVVPASSYLDLPELRTLAGRPGLALASEAEFAPLFPDCDIGAMPPFGALYGMPVYLDRTLAAGPDLVFEGGTHREEVRMPTAEYLRVAQPVVAPLAITHRAA
jgi:Ala-tRNA(Pro) deacylase